MSAIMKKPPIEVLGDKIPAESLNLPSFTPGETVRFYRRMLGLTQKELSVKSGVNKNMISDIENERRKMGYNTIVKIAKVLNRRPERFM
ncbi:MAG: helix-turn-helix transcriptional regulator [Spirochaetales bacterium]|nr:helix-turn-helix transcriptional regulator [Spirochaetales bacterium]